MTSRTDAPRLAILGAGPIGLEAALYAATLKLPVVVYERGRLGEYVQQWGHVRLFSPFGMNGTPLGRARLRADAPGHELPEAGDILTGREHFAAYLEPLAKSSLLQGALRLDTAVVSVARRGLLKEEGSAEARRGQPFRLLLRQGKKEWVEEADVVLDCTGTYGQARWLGEGGIPAVGEMAARPHIAAGLEDVLGGTPGALRRPHDTRRRRRLFRGHHRVQPGETGRVAPGDVGRLAGPGVGDPTDPPSRQ